MSRSPLTRLRRQHWFSLASVVALSLIWYSLFMPAYGAQLGNRSLQLSDNVAGDKSTYLLSFSLSTAGNLGSIEVDFCSNDPIPADPCSMPGGFTMASSALSAQSGQTGFAIAGSSSANHIVLTRIAAPAAPGPVSYTFTNATNPAAPGSYYVRVQTFASTDASGSASDYGGIAFAILNNVSISAQVPPYLIFCTGTAIPQPNCASASGDYINFGELSSQHANAGSSQMLSATNSTSGYTITISGTTLESGNNVIAALASNDVSRPGTAQFGVNLRANSSPAVGNDPNGPGSGTPAANYDSPNFYRFVAGDVIASSPAPDNIRIYTASYVVNVPPAQAPGVYVSTMTYICLATF
jgi:hypothetical protein